MCYLVKLVNLNGNYQWAPVITHDIFINHDKPSLHVLHRGARLATSSGDGTVKIWDFSKAECVLTFTDHTHAVWGCTWHSCGDFLASCSMDNTSKIWDVNRYLHVLHTVDE